jgi:hypothetical protein
MLTAALLLVVLVAAAIVVYLLLQWPPEALLGWVLLAVVLVGLLPVILLVLNRLATDGGSVGIPGVLELAFQAARSGPGANSAAHVSGNLGAPPGVDVHDSGGGNIMEALTQAVSNPVAVIDLGEGESWWESRLLLLLSGAARLGRPRAVVFVATRNRAPQQFLGWGEPRELLRCLLAMSDRELVKAYHRGRAEALKWQLGAPTDPGIAATVPWTPTYTIDPERSSRDLAPEALLMNVIATVESPGPVRSISIGRLDDLVGPVMRTTSVEDSAPEHEKLAAVLATTDAYIAVVDQGHYATVISRDVAVNAVLRSVVQSTDTDRGDRGR